MRREGIDRRLAQARAAEPAVDPAEIAEVPEQGRQVVEGSVEELDTVGDAIHPGRLRRATRMGGVIIVAGVPLGTPGATNMLRIAFVAAESTKQ